jgi:hypothetical protein
MTPYGSEAGFTSYAEAAGYDLPEGDIGAALVRGSLYIDGTYGDRFPGYPTGGSEQDRAWPRTAAADRYGLALPADSVPARVEHAAYEAALIELRAPGSLSRLYTPGEQKVLTEVKGIKWSVVGDASKDGAMRPVSTVIEGLLIALLVQHHPDILVV